jgi:inhibitor of Bruton tyrosine kinase
LAPTNICLPKDVALGSDGSLIVATQSGHVFVRSRNAKSGQSSGAKTFKFQRVPYLQRVIGVCANNTGAFGALRVDYHPAAIYVSDKSTSQHFAAIQPYLRFPSSAEQLNVNAPRLNTNSPELPPLHLPRSLGADDEGEDSTMQNDIRNLQRLCLLLTLDKESLKGPQGHHLFDCIPLTHGADLMVQSPSGSEFPVHRVWLAARSQVLCEVLSRTKTIHNAGSSKISLRFAHTNPSSTSSLPRLVFAGCSSMSILILLFYLYSDELLSIWDQRIAIALEQQLQDLKVQPAQVRLELQTLALILDLPKLAEVVQSPAKRMPSPSLVLDLQHLAQMTEKQGLAQIRARGLMRTPLGPDVIIRLSDRDVLCHSVVLRAGSSLFAALFDDNDWTAKRWDEYGVIKVDMRHWDWRIMQFPLRFLCSGLETEHELFDTLGKRVQFGD